MKIFDKHHLRKVNENWWQHFSWIMKANWVYIQLLIVGSIHAIFPFIFPEWGDKVLGKLVDSFTARRKRTGR